jgi:hypothetical protein
MADALRRLELVKDATSDAELAAALEGEFAPKGRAGQRLFKAFLGFRVVGFRV